MSLSTIGGQNRRARLVAWFHNQAHNIGITLKQCFGSVSDSTDDDGDDDDEGTEPPAFIDHHRERGDKANRLFPAARLRRCYDPDEAD